MIDIKRLTKVTIFTLLINVTSGLSIADDAVFINKYSNELEKSDIHIRESYDMDHTDYGFAPYVCKGFRFILDDEDLGDDEGGRLFVCKNKADQKRLANYYRSLSKRSAAFFSWVFEYKNYVLQINGNLSEGKAEIMNNVLNKLPK